jgi:hypothetical protein
MKNSNYADLDDDYFEEDSLYLIFVNYEVWQNTQYNSSCN